LKKLKLTLFLLFLFLTLILLLVNGYLQYHSVRLYAEAKRIRPFDAIIVPGVPYENESTARAMTVRIFWAKLLYDSGYTRNIIFSGAAVHSPYVEGIAMKIMADSLGIPPDHTFSETRAEHSTENAWYGWKMARRLGFQKIGLATNTVQSSILENFMHSYCPDVKLIPVVSSVLNRSDYSIPKIDARSAYVKDFVSLSERQGIWERLRGTMGRRVKEEYEKEQEKEEFKNKERK
jgi:hypothetical protein